MIVQPIIPRPKDSAGLANIDLSTKLRAFYQSPAHADIQLRAGSEVFPAHKIVLAAQSPTFERMFESGMVEQVMFPVCPCQSIRLLACRAIELCANLPSELLGQVQSASDSTSGS